MTTYSPPRVDGGAAAAIMRHSNTNHPSSVHLHGHHHHPSTLVTPLVSAKPWVGVESNNGCGGGGVTSASTLLPGKSTDSTDARSTGSSMHGGDGGGDIGGSVNSYASSAPTLATEPLSSMDERDGAANALLGLLSTTATVKGTRSTSPSSIPFKKRLLVDNKVQETVTTRSANTGKGCHNESNKSSTGTEDLAACHVSPVSHSSMSDHASRTESKDDGTPPRRAVKAGGGRQQQQQQQQQQHAGNGVATVSANRTSSYDSKDYLRGGNNNNKEALSHRSTHSSQRTLELLAESKVYNASQIGQMRGATPPAMATATTTTVSAVAGSAAAAAPPRMVPHFPTVLHQVLSDPQLSNVVQWLAEGESWKVVNWTALRRTVLPKYFRDLRDENGTVASAGTIDAFLFHLGAWGFEEVKETSKTVAASVGAYRHEVCGVLSGRFDCVDFILSLSFTHSIFAVVLSVVHSGGPKALCSHALHGRLDGQSQGTQDRFADATLAASSYPCATGPYQSCFRARRRI